MLKEFIYMAIPCKYYHSMLIYTAISIFSSFFFCESIPCEIGATSFLGVKKKNVFFIQKMKSLQFHLIVASPRLKNWKMVLYGSNELLIFYCTSNCGHTTIKEKTASHFW